MWLEPSVTKTGLDVFYRHKRGGVSIKTNNTARAGGKGKAMGSTLRLHFSSKHVGKLLLLRARLRRCTCMYLASCVGGVDRVGVGGVGSVTRVGRVGLVLALSVSSARAARPWSVQFGGCVFSGDYDGAPLERSGSCPTQAGTLDLGSRGITSVKSDSFAGMGACE